MRIVGSLIAVILVLLTSAVARAEDQTGTISGRVYDAKTGHLLPSASVFVKGTSRGAATDLDGYYVIGSLPLGTCTIEARCMGYKVSRVKNVQIEAGQTTTVDFRLEERILSPLPMVDSAMSHRDYFSGPSLGDIGTSVVAWRVPRKRLERGRFTDIEEILDVLPGVIRERDGLHVRGGRNTDITWEIDGISAIDPLYGDRAVSVPLSAMSTVQVTTAASEAESRSSEASNIIPEGPVRDFSGGATIASRLMREAGESVPYDADLRVTGPLFKRRELYLFCSGQASRNSSPFLPVLSDENKRSGLLRLLWNVQSSSSLKRIGLDAGGSIREWKPYDHRWLHNPSGLPCSREKNATSSITWHHTPSSGSVHYMVRLGALSVARDLKVEEKSWGEYIPPSSDPYGWIPSYFFTAGDYPLYHRSRERIYFGEGLLGAYLGPTAQLKTGFEFNRYNLELERKELSDTLFNEVKYVHRPYSFALYLQDHIERPGLIVNIGTRVQGFRDDQGSGLELQLLPRLGISLPITDKDKAFLCYGHFGGMPPLRFLRPERIGWHEGSPVFGNPDLGHERIITYQAGAQRFLLKRLLVSLSVFKKEGEDLLKIDSEPTREGELLTFANRGRLYSQGFECLTEAVFWKYLRGQMNYTYSIVRGDALRTNGWSELSYYHQLENRIPSWERQHSLSGDISLEFQNQGRIGGGEIGISGRYSSGFPYYVQEDKYASPAYLVLDCFTSARFRLLGLRESVFISVLNLLDRKNVLEVDEATGQAGGLFADPTHWGERRRVVFGTTIEW